MPLTSPIATPQRMPNGIGEHRAGRSEARQPRGHHAAGRHHPRHRQIDLAEQDDEHHAGGDDAEEGGDLELLQQIFGRQEARE